MIIWHRSSRRQNDVAKRASSNHIETGVLAAPDIGSYVNSISMYPIFAYNVIPGLYLSGAIIIHV